MPLILPISTQEKDLDAVKHAQHDQSSHGNWASGGGGGGEGGGPGVSQQLRDSIVKDLYSTGQTPKAYRKREKARKLARELIRMRGFDDSTIETAELADFLESMRLVD